MDPMNSVKAKFMEGPETAQEDAGEAGDPLAGLSPAGQEAFKAALEQGVIPTIADLTAQGLGSAEAQEVIELIDMVLPDNEGAEGGAPDDGNLPSAPKPPVPPMMPKGFAR